MDRFPKVTEWIGERALQQLRSHNYVITNKKFEATVSIPREDFEDNDFGKYAPVFEDMGRESSEFPNEHVFGLLKNGFTTFCFDGQNFFDRDHPHMGVEGDSTVQSNIYDKDPAHPASGKAWYLLDTSRALKPLVWQERIKPELESKVDPSQSDYVFMNDQVLFGIRARGNAGFSFWQLAVASKEELNTEHFNGAYEMMTSRKDHQDRPMHIKPMLLVVPPSLRQKAHEVVLKEFDNQGESNINYKIVDVFVCPYLE